MSGTSWFTPDLFSFLDDLRANNDRAWFQEHRERYDRHLKQPFLGFLSDLAPRMEKISKQIIVDPRPNGGSLFRIYRDTRFAADKSPYKTHAGAQFRHTLCSGDVHAPGYYLHLEPGQVFYAAGVWQPDKKTLTGIRDLIVERSERWKKITDGATFTGHYHLSGSTLKRPPQGYPADHPLIEDLKRKDFIIVTDLNEADACSPGFLDTIVDLSRAYAPFMQFLCEAIQLEW